MIIGAFVGDVADQWCEPYGIDILSALLEALCACGCR